MPGFNTRAIHVGSEPDPSSNAVIPPISLSTTFKQDKVGVHKVRSYSFRHRCHTEANLILSSSYPISRVTNTPDLRILRGPVLRAH